MKKSVEKRIDFINEYLLEKTRVTVKELAHDLNMTPETIRKDLTFLETKGFLFRTHGGAVLRNSYVDVPMEVRTQERLDLKKSICTKAIDLINNDDVVFIDPSSTALFLGKLIRIRKNIVLVTNCIELLQNAIDSGQQIIFLGGTYSRSGKRTQGQFTIDMIDKLSFDVAIFGMDGCLGISGPGTQTDDAMFMNRAIMKRCRKNILVSESTKFDRTAKFQYAEFSQFDVFITDTNLKTEDTQRIGIDLIVQVQV